MESIDLAVPAPVIAMALYQRFNSRDTDSFSDRLLAAMRNKFGVEDRAAFYEQAGALRDILQNHLIQVLSLIAMEVPSAFNAESIRQEKIKVLRSVRPIATEDVVFGRYTAGEIGGSKVVGYLEESGVPADSTTETFVAAKLTLDNWRWQGVPFYVRMGKRLPRKLTEIAVRYHKPPVCMFESMGSCLLNSNLLRARARITSQDRER